MTMIEKVAKAIKVVHEDWEYQKKSYDLYKTLAQIAIQAMKEPTEEMITKFNDVTDTAGLDRQAYKAMIEEALK